MKPEAYLELMYDIMRRSMGAETIQELIQDEDLAVAMHMFAKDSAEMSMEWAMAKMKEGVRPQEAFKNILQMSIDGALVLGYNLGKKQVPGDV